MPRLLSKEQKDKRSDATGDDSSNAAGKIIHTVFKDRLTTLQNFTFRSAKSSVTFMGEKDNRNRLRVLFIQRRTACAKP